MEPRERVMAALRGEPVDRPPVALWRHFPEEDQTAEGLAQATAEWQRRWEWDFVKVTPTSGYPVEDWGATFEYRPNDHGTRTLLTHPLRRREDLEALRLLNVHAGVYGRELKALSLLRAELGDETFILETVFSPLNTLHRLTGDFFFTAMREFSSQFRSALRIVTEVTTLFSRAALDAGADGIFFATQMAQPSVLSEEEFLTWGVPYDLDVLDAVRAFTDFLLLHIHGDEIYFHPLVETYPVDAVNWHAGTADPTLAEALDAFDGAVVGGITESVLVHGPPDAIRQAVLDAVTQTQGQRHIVAAGCVTPIVTPEAHIAAVKPAVEELGRGRV